MQRKKPVHCSWFKSLLSNKGIARGHSCLRYSTCKVLMFCCRSLHRFQAQRSGKLSESVLLC